MLKQSRVGFGVLLVLSNVVGCIELSGDPSLHEDPSLTEGRVFKVVTDSVTIEPGQESVTCFFPKLGNLDPTNIRAITSDVGIGHHLLVYAVPNPIESAPVNCNQGGQPSWRVLVGTQNGKGEFKLPNGVGFLFEEDQQLVLEVHGVNTGSEPIKVSGSVNFEVAAPHSVKQQASTLFIGPTNFLGNPLSTVAASASCTVPDDISVTRLFGHQHALGTGVSVHFTGGSKPDVTYVSDDWHSPPLMADTLQLGPNSDFTTVNVDCAWNNTADKPMVYLNEMCFGIGVFWPADKGQLMCVTAGASNECQCIYATDVDPGIGDNTLEVKLGLDPAIAIPGETDWGAPIYCNLYDADDNWGVFGPIDPTLALYSAQNQETSFVSADDRATLVFRNVAAGDLGLLCYMDSKGGGLAPQSGSPIAIANVTVQGAPGVKTNSSVEATLSLLLP